jgi:hypothetical protein
MSDRYGLERFGEEVWNLAVWGCQCWVCGDETREERKRIGKEIAMNANDCGRWSVARGILLGRDPSAVIR